MTYKTFKESYKHRAAKRVLSSWIVPDYTVKVEQYFGFGTFVFRPDITTFNNGQIDAFYEVVNKNPIDGKKLGKMQYYCYINGLDVLCHEVSAEWILSQTDKPEALLKDFTYDLCAVLK